MRYPGENSAGRAAGRRQNPSGRTTPPEERTAASRVSAGSKSPGGDASLFAPGYSGPGGAAREPVAAGGGAYGASGGAAGKGPIRGFPPAPGQPPPLYPPGLFSAWNRASGQSGNGYDGAASDVWLAMRDPETAGPGVAAGAAFADGVPSDTGYPDPGYPDAAYSDTGYPGAGTAEPGPPGGTDQFAVPGFADPGYSDPDYAALAVSDPAADVTSTQSWGAVDAAASSWSDLSTADDQWSRPQPRQGATSGLAAPPGAGASPGGGVLPPGATPPAGLARAPHDERGDQHQAGGPPGPFDRAAPGPFDRGPSDRVATGPNQRAATGPNQRVATGPNQRPGAGPGDRAPGGRGRGSRGRSRPGGGGRRVRTLLICGLALIVVVGATYFWFARGSKHPAAAIGSTHAKSRPSATDPSPTPSLGPWGHITTRALDPVPLSLAELFPGQFSNAGINYVRTAAKAKLPHCAAALIGSQLIAAVSKAGCTQALRASYLSSNRKLMGTIGVLNLVNTAAADKAGKATGPTEFIAQLPGAHGLTRFLTKGTGFEAAEIKGHYLVLVWAEFASQHAPKTAGQKSQLSGFISLLMQQTANVALANRMVTGSPAPSPPA